MKDLEFVSRKVLRQVQLIVGSLLLLSAAGGLFVDVRFIWGAFVIATGMLVAGFTDWCQLTVLVERLPWNRE